MAMGTLTYDPNPTNCMTQKVQAVQTSQSRTFNYSCDPNLGLVLSEADVESRDSPVRDLIIRHFSLVSIAIARSR
jgi:hypothetical protein